MVKPGYHKTGFYSAMITNLQIMKNDWLESVSSDPRELKHCHRCLKALHLISFALWLGRRFPYTPL